MTVDFGTEANWLDPQKIAASVEITRLPMGLVCTYGIAEGDYGRNW